MKQNNTATRRESPNGFHVRPAGKFLLLAISIFISSLSFATHFRYGFLTATRLSETPTTVTYRLDLSEAWRLTTAPTTSPFIISGGNSGSINIPMTNVTDPSGGWTNSSGSAVVTLNKTPVPTRIEWISCCKISTILNNNDQQWDIYTVINTNAPGNSPVSTLPAIINMPVGAAAATYPIPASDPDAGATLTFGAPAFVGGLIGQTNPLGFSVSPSGLISFNTIGKSIGDQYNAMVTVTDNDGNEVMLDFLINMVGPSTPPVFDYSVTPLNGSVFNVIAGQNIAFPIRATDMDSASTVSLSVSGLPAYITVANFSANPLPATGNPSNTNFSWTPAVAQIGHTVVLNFIATDNVGVQTTSSVTIKVVAEPAPVFISPTPIEASIRQILTGVLLSDSIVAQSILGSNVSIAFATGIPGGAILTPAVPTAGANPGRTTLDWTPVPADWGLHNLSYQATIASAPTIFSTRNYQLLVNTLPVFSSVAPASVILGNTYSYTITATDADIPYGDFVDIVGSTVPSWLTLIPTGNGTAVLTGTPAAGDVGLHVVELDAEDIHHHGNPFEVEQIFTILVIQPDPLVGTVSASIYGGGYNISCNGGSDGTASVTASGGTIPYTYAWSTSPVQTTSTATGLSAGTYTVVVTDAVGATIELTISLIQPAPVAANAGPNATVYYGYGPGACTTLSGSASGGVAPYAFAWSNGATTAAVNVCPTVSTQYTLVVTDANGCTATDMVRVCVTDVHCAKGGNAIVYYSGGKVLVCHIPDGDVSKRITLCISADAVPDHLAHGDVLGICGTSTACVGKSLNGEEESLIIGDETNLVSYPNPFMGTMIVRFNTVESGKAEVAVFNVMGIKVASLFNGTVNGMELHEEILNADNLPNGIYFVKLITDQGEMKAERIILSR
jgi:hypothetical protein